MNTLDEKHALIPHVIDGARCERHENLGCGRQIWAGMGWGKCVHCEREKAENAAKQS